MPQGSLPSAVGTGSGGGGGGGAQLRGSWERLELVSQPLPIAQLEGSSVCLLPDAPVGVTPPGSPATWCW